MRQIIPPAHPSCQEVTQTTNNINTYARCLADSTGRFTPNKNNQINCFAGTLGEDTDHVRERNIN